jgi:outer membrane receptor protein involved in Fe transport
VVQDAIGADQISRSPDGDAAAALKRVPGLSVVDGRFAYVRGLGERYSSTTLNGAPLASPVPDRKVIPLDLFPSGFLESVVTAKSYSPEHPGDYAGGLVQLRTKAFPSQRVFSVSFSSGWNSTSTFGDGLGYAGGGRDFLGFDDGLRELPASVPRDTPLTSAFVASADRFDIARDFQGDWGPTPERGLPPNTSVGLTFGDDLGLGRDQRLGFIVSANYSSSVGVKQDLVERVFTAAGGAAPELDYAGQVTERSVTLGGMASVTYQPAPTHQLELATFYTRIADDASRVLTGFQQDANTNLRNTRIQYLGQSLLNAQLSGEHVLGFLGKAALEWRGGFSRATRYEPNTREVLYRQLGSDGRYLWESFVQSGSIFHQDMTDDGVSAGGSLRLPFSFRDLPASIAVGGSLDRRTRDTYTRRFRYVPAPGAVLDADFRAQEPNDLFRPANIGPAGFTIQEATFRTDNYDAEERITAGFVKADMELLPRLKLSGGARIEATEQIVSPRDFWDSGLPGLEGAEESSSDVLPAVNLTYELIDGMNLRASASRTLARPQLRELAPFSFADYAGGYLVSGNPRLTRTLIENFDLRWEWFTTPRSVLAVSGFYKKFDEPLESLVLPATEFIKSWVNADGATNYGVEIEARSDLGFVAPALADVSFNGNLTLVSSDVQTGRVARIYIPGTGKVDLQVVDRDRALQGQSPYVANLGLSWFDGASGMSASVLFNRFGRRIDAVGGQGTPDIYEEARSQLDLVVEAPVLGGWTAKVSAGRVLGHDVEFTQGGDLLRAWDQGRTLSFGLSRGSGR